MMNVFEIARLARQAAKVAIKNNRPITEVADEIRRVVAEHGINPHRDPNAIGRIYREAVEEVEEEREVDAQAEAHYDEMDRLARSTWII